MRILLRRIREGLGRIWPPRFTEPKGSGPLPGPRPLYVFFDESGNLDFSKSGSRYFLCGVLVTYNPWPLMQALTGLREEIFRGGFIPEAFHATEDKQVVRDRVFRAIVQVGGFEAHIAVTEKAQVPTSHREGSTFYTFMSDYSLRRVLQHYPADEPIYVITDELPLKGKREALVKGFKASLAAILPNREYKIEHHSSGSQGCLQVIDYVNWAVFRRLELSDERSYVLISDYIAYEGALDWTLVRGSQKE